MDYYKLDELGRPVLTDMVDYYAWKSTFPEAQQTGAGFTVAKDSILGVTVSTVYLGMNHQFGDGPPVLWETMVFGYEGDEYCQRYSSLAEAKEGHRFACEQYLEIDSPC